jgi:hypothetical protein
VNRPTSLPVAIDDARGARATRVVRDITSMAGITLTPLLHGRVAIARTHELGGTFHEASGRGSPPGVEAREHVGPKRRPSARRRASAFDRGQQRRSSTHSARGRTDPPRRCDPSSSTRSLCRPSVAVRNTWRDRDERGNARRPSRAARHHEQFCRSRPISRMRAAGRPESTRPRSPWMGLGPGWEDRRAQPVEANVAETFCAD